MASFTMSQLLKLHGLEDLPKDEKAMLMVLLSHQLRLRGWRLRRIHSLRRNWNIWSDVVKDHQDEVHIDPWKMEELMKKILDHLPVGNVEPNGTRWFE